MCQTYCSNDFKIRQQVTTTKKSHLLKVTFTFSNSKSNPRSLQKNQKDRKLVTEAFTHPFTKPKFDSNCCFEISLSLDFCLSFTGLYRVSGQSLLHLCSQCMVESRL